MCKFSSQSDVKHIMMLPIKTIMSVLLALTDIITNFPARRTVQKGTYRDTDGGHV